MKYILCVFLPIILMAYNARATLNDVDRQEIVNKNILAPYNPGFESGKALATGTSWTIGTDTTALATSGTNLLIGKASLTWDSAGAGRILASKAVTIPKGLYGRNGLMKCLIMTPSGTATHTLTAYDGANTIATMNIISSTLPTPQPLNFIFPSSGTIQIRITSVNANEPSVTIDDCYIGEAANLGNVSQAQFIGSAKILGTSSCTLSRTSTTIGAFTTTAACPGPTVISNPGPGTIQTTDADLPRVTVNSVSPGIYRVQMSVYGYNTTSGQTACFAINDGTTTTPNLCVTAAAASRGSAITVEGYFTYTTTANITYELYGASASGTVTLDISSGPPTQDLSFSITRFPSISELGFRADIGPSSWSGYHDSTCSFSRTNTAYGDPGTDASCALTEVTNRNFSAVTGANNLPSITFTPTRTGMYYVCANVGTFGATLGAGLAARLWDGTTVIAEAGLDNAGTSYVNRLLLCGIYNNTTTAAKTFSIQTKASTGAITIRTDVETHAIDWSVIAIDFGMNTPLLTQSIVGGTSGQAIAREEWGDVYTTASGTVCSASPCASVTSNGVSSVTRTSTGIYVINFSPAFTVAPVCNEISTNAFRLFDQTGATTSAVTINTDTGTIAIPVAADSAFTFRCIGVR